MSQFILALDQGTTSSRAILFDHSGRAVASDQQEFEQILPKPGHVEHDAEAIWRTQLKVAQNAIQQAEIAPGAIAAIGITNQRETTVLWERDSGKAIANAIVWQSRVSAPVCQRLKEQGGEDLIREKTGLLLDPYFSGTKIRHLLDSTAGLRERAEAGEVLFGTIDTFLLWRLTGGRVHATDVSNASRTLLLNIHTCEWDDELLEIIGVPHAMLPQVKPSSCLYGETEPEFFGQAIPIGGMAGDQQAATFGQACFEVGSVKNTYGTGCFMLMNTGDKPVASQNRLLTTVGWQLEGEQPVYCLEGSVFIAGAVVQWLRDGLGIIKSSSEVEKLAATVEDSDGVFLVPAFTGLGAPHWDPNARGAILGITRGTTAGHLARAALESMAYQTRDLVVAMQKDASKPLAELKVDGGASVNDSLMQFQADLLDCKVIRPTVAETTALGAAYLAGLAVGFWESTEEVVANWQLDREFTPNMTAEKRAALCKDWHRAVERSLDWEDDED